MMNANDEISIIYRGTDGNKYIGRGVIASSSWDSIYEVAEFEVITNGEHVRFGGVDGMKHLRDEVYFTDAGEMIQATWGLIIHYAWEYTGDMRIFTEYTEEMIWNELREVGIEQVSEYDFNEWIDDNGENELEHWIVTEDDKISQVSHRAYMERFRRK